jgi:hypothetical protein
VTPSAQHRRLLVPACLLVAALACMPGQAQAQWGGFGFGAWGAFRPVPSPQIYLNQKSLIDAQRDTHIPTGHPYANSPNAYFNRVRDNGFVERYDPVRHGPNYYRYTSASARIPQGATTMTSNQQRPMLPLESFFNAAGQLVWPSDAPTAGVLKAKRDAVDEACAAALKEKKQNRVASMATVTDARNKLLEFGRPALESVRTHETPRVADSFHLFLLALYDSLAQTAIPESQVPAAIPSG